MGWGLGLPFPDYQQVTLHLLQGGGRGEEGAGSSSRASGIENSEMERWLPVGFPARPDKAIVYPDPFDCARFGMDFAHSTVEIIDGVGAVR